MSFNPYETNGIFHKTDGHLYIFKIHRLYIHIYFKNIVFPSLKIFIVRANSADPDEMQQYAAFHLGLHCFSK